MNSYTDLQTLCIRFQALCALVVNLIPEGDRHRAALALSLEQQSDLALSGLITFEGLAQAARQYDLLPPVADTFGSGAQAIPSEPDASQPRVLNEASPAPVA